MLKGSFTVEATFIMIIFLSIISITLNMGIDLYREIQCTHEEQMREELWLVDDFYRLAIFE